KPVTGEGQFPGVVINHIIIVFTAGQQDSVQVNPFTSRNDDNENFIVVARKPVRPLISVFTDDLTRSEFPAGSASRYMNPGFGIIGMVEFGSYFQSGYFLGEISKEVLFLNK